MPLLYKIQWSILIPLTISKTNFLITENKIQREWKVPMMNQDTFAEWLRTNADIKSYSIGRYSKAINTISSELGDYGLQKLIYST